MQRVFEKKLVSQLEPGMYVAELDRPWLDTPFLVEGFLIESEDDIDQLAKYCLYVYVDQGLSRTTASAPTSHRTPIGELFPNRKLKAYSDQCRIEEELAIASGILNTLGMEVEQAFDKLSQNQTISLKPIREAAKDMVASIARNPDAILWLNRLRSNRGRTYQHAVSVAIWMAALGRQLGLPKADLETLAMGGILLDVGKLKIPCRILGKKGRLSEAEFEQVKQHVQYGLKDIQETGGANNQILAIIAGHHERIDGSGYPEGLSGHAIPIFARIAAIADCYAAITNQRPYAPPMPASKAIQKLYEWRGKHFQPELVEEFIQAIGIYPAGTLVELSSGEVGVVLSEYRSRRLRPKVIQLLNSNKQPLPTVKVVDLLTTTHDSQGKPLNIVDCLEPGAYGIDLSTLELA